MKESLISFKTAKKLFCYCCGKEIAEFTDYTCHICMKTICPNCVGHMEIVLDDYNEVYCESCWVKIEPDENNIV